MQSGTCLGFGSAFDIPLIVKLDMPNPAPESGNCDVINCWKEGKVKEKPVENQVQVAPAKVDETFKTKTVTTSSAGTINASNINTKSSSGIVPYSNTVTNSEPVIIRSRQSENEITPNLNRLREFNEPKSSATDKLLGDSFGTSPSISKIMNF